MFDSNEVNSSQTEIHGDLQKVVQKHVATEFKRPVQQHTKKAYQQVKNQIERLGMTERSILLDSCCGVGMSTYTLAALYPESLVIGIDKSSERINKSEWYRSQIQESIGSVIENAIIERADIIDFWRLALEDGLKIEKHYILYPNPWPKQSALTKRWQGHPVFPDLCRLCSTIELRSNWKLYLDEFNAAYQIVTHKGGEISEHKADGTYLTAFEKKYVESGQTIWKLLIQ